MIITTMQGRVVFHWHLVGKGQGSFQTSYNAQDSFPPLHRIIQSKMSLVLTLRNPAFVEGVQASTISGGNVDQR